MKNHHHVVPNKINLLAEDSVPKYAINNFGPDVFPPVIALVLFDQSRIVMQIEGETVSLHSFILWYGVRQRNCLVRVTRPTPFPRIREGNGYYRRPLRSAWPCLACHTWPDTGRLQARAAPRSHY